MPIPGTTSIAHVRENLAAQDLELGAEDLRRITGLRRTV
jgi:aryl-alcohol dehydrogenase-like predicted oxidoreductase